VRIVRAVRFAAKLGFEIEPKTRKPIQAMAPLLENVPQSRLFDEMIKLLQTGHSLASLDELRKQGLNRGTFALLDTLLDETRVSEPHQEFVRLALEDTDRRVGEGKSVSPSFMLACMLWHEVQSRWQQIQSAGEPAFAALQQAVEAVFDARISDISGRGKLAGDMREIWLMQPRFDRRVGNSPFTLVEQPRFRAGFDFLRLRADAGEASDELARWWEDFSLADEAARAQLMIDAREHDLARRHSPSSGEPPVSDPTKKRRRRRRKPSGESTASADTQTSTDAA
jgi:poly(A) polymerase